MNDNSQNPEQKIVIGCGVLTVSVLMILFMAVAWGTWQDRRALQYPEASLLASRSNYRNLPAEFRWNDTYSTADNVEQVLTWYVREFEMQVQDSLEGGGRCETLRQSDNRLLVRRTATVMVCRTAGGAEISITRATALR